MMHIQQDGPNFAFKLYVFFPLSKLLWCSMLDGNVAERGSPYSTFTWGTSSYAHVRTSNGNAPTGGWATLVIGVNVIPLLLCIVKCFQNKISS